MRTRARKEKEGIVPLQGSHEMTVCSCRTRSGVDIVPVGTVGTVSIVGIVPLGAAVLVGTVPVLSTASIAADVLGNLGIVGTSMSLWDTAGEHSIQT